MGEISSRGKLHFFLYGWAIVNSFVFLILLSIYACQSRGPRPEVRCQIVGWATPPWLTYSLIGIYTWSIVWNMYMFSQYVMKALIDKVFVNNLLAFETAINSLTGASMCFMMSITMNLFITKRDSDADTVIRGASGEVARLIFALGWFGFIIYVFLVCTPNGLDYLPEKPMDEGDPEEEEEVEEEV